MRRGPHALPRYPWRRERRDAAADYSVASASVVGLRLLLNTGVSPTGVARIRWISENVWHDPLSFVAAPSEFGRTWPVLAQNWLEFVWLARRLPWARYAGLGMPFTDVGRIVSLGPAPDQHEARAVLASKFRPPPPHELDALCLRPPPPQPTPSVKGIPCKRLSTLRTEPALVRAKFAPMSCGDLWNATRRPTSPRPCRPSNKSFPTVRPQLLWRLASPGRRGAPSNKGREAGRGRLAQGKLGCVRSETPSYASTLMPCMSTFCPSLAGSMSSRISPAPRARNMRRMWPVDRAQHRRQARCHAARAGRDAWGYPLALENLPPPPPERPTFALYRGKQQGVYRGKHLSLTSGPREPWALRRAGGVLAIESATAPARLGCVR